MRVAIVGSRGINISDFEKYLPEECNEIVSGGAKGVDECAAEYAKRNEIKLSVFLPQYEKFGRAAPIVRNKQIVDYSDRVIAFWDGESKGTYSVIKYCKKVGVPCDTVIMKKDSDKERSVQV